MIALTTAIYDKLAGSALNTAIGGRLFEGVAPEGTEFPFAVYMIVSDTPADTFTDSLDDVLIQFSLFSQKPGSSEVKGLYSDLKTLYDDCPLTVAGRTIVWMKRVRMSLAPEEETTPQGTGMIWHCDVDYNIIEQR